MIYKIVICDDKLEDLNSLKELLQEKCEKLQLSVEIRQYENPYFLIGNIDSHIDALFLKIEMSELNGLTLAKVLKINNKDMEIIFMSNYEHFVYDSFELKPLYFVRRTKLSDELDKALLLLKKELRKTEGNISLLIDNNMIQVEAKCIVFIESNKNYIVLHLNSGKELRVRMTMNSIENLLVGHGFIRVHIGYLVNFKYIKELKENVFVLYNNTQLSISRDRIHKVKQIYFGLTIHGDC